MPLDRQRTRKSTGPRGSVGWADQEYESYSNSFSTCYDVMGARNSAFIVDHTTTGAGLSHTWIRPSGYLMTFSGWTPEYFCDPTVVSHMAVPGEPSLAQLAVQLAMATNPSKSSIDLPVSLFELRDLPDLVRASGRGIIRRIADGNLKYQFGVKPMVSDVMKLLDFSSAFDQQLKLLQQLQKGGVTRKAQLWSGSSTEEPKELITAQSYPSDLLSNYRLERRSTSVQIWGYITYTPHPTNSLDFSRMQEREMRLLARKIVLGLTLDLSAAWEALPWSWLIDWFSNIGDYLSSSRSLVPVVGDTPSLCITRSTEQLYVNSGNAYGLPPGSHTIVMKRLSKRRVKQSAMLPSADWSLLTGRQVGILASLSALRGLGR